MQTQSIRLWTLLLLLAGAFCAPAQVQAASPTCTSPEKLLSWPAVNPVWEMCWLRPSQSAGADGSGIELRKIHFKGHLVMRRAHAPMLFAEYRTSTCYRDWKDDDATFLSDRLVQNTLGVPVDPPAAITSCDRSQNPTQSYGACPYGLAGYPNAAASCARGLSIEDGSDHVTLTSQYSAAWYQYTSRWTFYADGRIEPEFGFGNSDGTNSGITHWHHNYWRMEFDIDGSGANTLSINGADQATEFNDLRDQTGGPGGTPKTWEVRDPVTGNGYKLVPGAEDYRIPANESGRGFHMIDVMGTRQHDGEYADRSDNPLGVCAMNEDALVNDESLLGTPIALYYRVSVRDATANDWPPGCTPGVDCHAQDSMICKKRGPTLVPFGPWVDGATPEPVAAIAPNSFAFKLVAGQAGNDTLSIGNVGAVGSSLDYTITETADSCANPTDVAWLSAMPAAASVVPGATQQVAINVSSAGLAAGGHAAKLCVTTNDASHALTEIPVALTVTAVVEPEAGITPTSLAFTVPAGLTDSATVTVANTGTPGSALDWSLTHAGQSCLEQGGPAWLAATPTAGSVAAGSSAAINVAVDAAALTAGSYVGTLCISTDDPAHMLVAVRVDLTVEAGDGIFTDGFEGAIVQAVTDPGFEMTERDGGVNAAWTGTDSRDPSVTPFYSASHGIPVYAGHWQAWFGGWGGGEPLEQVVSRRLTIPAGARYLHLWRLLDRAAEGTAVLRVGIDGKELLRVDATGPIDAAFVPQSVGIGEFADGKAHVLAITYVHDGHGSDGDLYIDQVSIDASAAPRAMSVQPRVGHRDPRVSKKHR